MSTNDGITLDDERWQRLQTRLLSVIAEQVPDWTDQQDSDPGSALVELFAFLGEQLAFRANAVPESGRARLFATAAKLESVTSATGGGATVCVDGQEWRQTDTFSEAGPADPVFIVTDDGGIAFGDGQRGRRPAADSQVFVSYRAGVGGAGNARVSVVTRWPPQPLRYALALDASVGVSIATTHQVDQFSGRKRVNYFDGQLLGPEDFRDEQQYWLGKHRLHNQALHGWGVVTGLTVTTGSPSSGTIIVEPGLMIDATGREVALRDPVTLTSTASSPQFVAVSYVERKADPVPTASSSGDEKFSRIDEGASVLLTEQDDATVGVVVGRVIRTGAGWQLDATYQPRRVRASR